MTELDLNPTVMSLELSNSSHTYDMTSNGMCCCSIRVERRDKTKRNHSQVFW